MREFWRVLKIGGWAILQVPIISDVTFEIDRSPVPLNGSGCSATRSRPSIWPDYRDWLVDAGFSVTVDGFVRELDEKTVSRYGLVRSEDVYFCRKEVT